MDTIKTSFYLIYSDQAININRVDFIANLQIQLIDIIYRTLPRLTTWLCPI
jgi:hypothetical protein